MSDSRLSKSQEQLGEKILNALTNIVKMPVTSHEWKYVPQVDGYELVISTPWVKEKGPEAANWALLDALDMAHISESTSFVRFEAPDLKTAQAGA
jgi:hypothetical protein